MIDRDVQNSLMKVPIPITVGNVSLSGNLRDEYFSDYVYLVNDRDGLVVFDRFTNKWKLIKDVINFSTMFPRFNSYEMNGFTNANNGFPSFEGTVHYDASLSTWVYGFNTNGTMVSGSYNIYNQIAIDLADDYFGDSTLYSSHVISSFIPGEKIEDIYYTEKLYPLVSGNIQQLSSVLVFKNGEATITGMITDIPNSVERSILSPQIISGENCLGFYFDDETLNPYILGSICVGTNNLTTVPPIIGNNYRNYKDLYANDGIDKCYWHIGTTIDPNKDKWNLLQITTDRYSSNVGLRNGNYILIKDRFNPFKTNDFYYCEGSTSDKFFSYSKLRYGKTFISNMAGRDDITINIVGLTNINADMLKHGEIIDYRIDDMGNKIYHKFYDTYIGNWISPQCKWR